MAETVKGFFLSLLLVILIVVLFAFVIGSVYDQNSKKYNVRMAGEDKQWENVTSLNTFFHHQIRFVDQNGKTVVLMGDVIVEEIK